MLIDQESQTLCFNRNLCAAMTNATTKLRFCATPKSDILCNTDVHHGSPPFLQSEILTFLQQNFFVAKNAEISDCKNGRFPCCTSVLHKIYDFGVAQNLNFVVALVIAAHKFLLFLPKRKKKGQKVTNEVNIYFPSSQKQLKLNQSSGS